MEAATRFERVVMDLQSTALPLGYAAAATSESISTMSGGVKELSLVKRCHFPACFINLCGYAQSFVCCIIHFWTCV